MHASGCDEFGRRAKLRKKSLTCDVVCLPSLNTSVQSSFQSDAPNVVAAEAVRWVAPGPPCWEQTSWQRRQEGSFTLGLPVLKRKYRGRRFDLSSVWLFLVLCWNIKESSKGFLGTVGKGRMISTVGCRFMDLIIGLVFANVFLLFLVRNSSPIVFSLREGSFMLSAWMLFPIFHNLSVS